MTKQYQGYISGNVLWTVGSKQSVDGAAADRLCNVLKVATLVKAPEESDK